MAASCRAFTVSISKFVSCAPRMYLGNVRSVSYQQHVKNWTFPVVPACVNQKLGLSHNGPVCMSSTDTAGHRPYKNRAGGNLWWRLSLLAGSLGLGYYVWRNGRLTAIPIVNADGIPNAKPSRSIRIPNDNSGLHLTLYQYQTCPFCCKVRAYLDYMGISYDIVEVNPVLRQQIKFSSWKKVPIIIVKDGNGYQQLNDSSTIISLLQSHLVDKKKGWNELRECYPLFTYTNDQGKEAKEFLNRYSIMYGDHKKINRKEEELQEEAKWRSWADEVLVHTLSPNVYRTMGEAKQAFDWFSKVGEWEKNFPFWERMLVIYMGATAMYFVGKRLKKRHALKEDVRESLYDACKEWTSAIGSKKKFAGGDKPNLADLAVYGVLNAIEGCSAFKELLANTDIEPWFSRMKIAIASHNGSA